LIPFEQVKGIQASNNPNYIDKPQHKRQKKKEIILSINLNKLLQRFSSIGDFMLCQTLNMDTLSGILPYLEESN
jgi:hypothetical protein